MTLVTISFDDDYSSSEKSPQIASPKPPIKNERPVFKRPISIRGFNASKNSPNKIDSPDSKSNLSPENKNLHNDTTTSAAQSKPKTSKYDKISNSQHQNMSKSKNQIYYNRKDQDYDYYYDEYSEYSYSNYSSNFNQKKISPEVRSNRINPIRSSNIQNHHQKQKQHYKIQQEQTPIRNRRHQTISDSSDFSPATQQQPKQAHKRSSHNQTATRNHKHHKSTPKVSMTNNNNNNNNIIDIDNSNENNYNNVNNINNNVYYANYDGNTFTNLSSTNNANFNIDTTNLNTTNNNTNYINSNFLFSNSNTANNNFITTNINGINYATIGNTIILPAGLSVANNVNYNNSNVTTLSLIPNNYVNFNNNLNTVNLNAITTNLNNSNTLNSNAIISSNYITGNAINNNNTINTTNTTDNNISNNNDNSVNNTINISNNNNTINTTVNNINNNNSDAVNNNNATINNNNGNDIVDSNNTNNNQNLVKMQIENPIPATCLTDPVSYRMTRSNTVSLHGKMIHYQLYLGGRPLLHTKIKTLKQSGICYVGEGAELHLSHKQYTGAVLYANNRSNFSIRKRDEYGEEVMSILYKQGIDSSPRNMNIFFPTPPNDTPPKLYNRQCTLIDSNWVLDMKGKDTMKSIKNCVIVDENNNEFAYVRKVEKKTLAIDATENFSELMIFAIGLSSFLCKTC